MSCWLPSSLKGCNFFFFLKWPREQRYFQSNKKIVWDREQARSICTEFFSVTGSLGGAHSSFIMQAAPGNSWRVQNDALPVGRLWGLWGHPMQTSAALSSVPLHPTPKACSQQTHGSHSGGLLLSSQCPRHADDRGFTTAQNGAFCFLLDYSKFGAC